MDSLTSSEYFKSSESQAVPAHIKENAKLIFAVAFFFCTVSAKERLERGKGSGKREFSRGGRMETEGFPNRNER